MQHEDMAEVYESEEEYEYDEEGAESDGHIEAVDAEGVVGSDHDGAIEEVSDEEGEIVDDEEEDEEGGAGGGGGGGAGGQQQMLFIPGLGYFPLSQLGNIPGLGGLAARQQQAAQPSPEGVREWDALSEFPDETQHGLYELLSQLKDDNRAELTVLLLGKGGVGKSSTINSLLNERAAATASFQAASGKPVTYSRSAAGFTLNLIDTPSLLDQDNVSDKRLEDLAEYLSGRKGGEERAVDAVLYLDRLDSHRVGTLDKRVLAGISRVLGPAIWNNTILCFTHASESSAPPGVAFEDWVDERAQQLRSAIAQVGGKDADLEVALVENSSQCARNEQDEKVVPGGEPWVVELMRLIKETALAVPEYVYDPAAAAKASNPDRRRKWLIPLVLLAQIALKLLLDRVIEEDEFKGDANGPFDAQTSKEKREDAKREKEERRRKAEREKQRKEASAAAAAEYEEEYSDLDEDDY